MATPPPPEPPPLGMRCPCRIFGERFDANVAAFDASRVRKLVGDSKRVVADLEDERARLEFVYVDGSHMALDVLVDAALSRSVLAVDGFLVFDDYGRGPFGLDPF